jgi:hypothetical protein
MLPVGGLTVNVCATVQKLKRPACGEFSIPSGTRGYVTSGFIHAQNSGTIRATRPLGRGTVCPRIDDSRLRGNDKFMIYDLKAEGSQVLDCGFRIGEGVVAGPPSLRPAEDKVRKTKPMARSGAPRRCPAVEIPQRSTVLSFHHPLPKPGGTKPEGWGTRGQMRKTNPTLRLRIADSGQTYGETRAAAGHPRAGWAAGRRNAQNEPNLRRGPVGRGPTGVGRGELCETKPNLGKLGYPEDVTRGGPVVQNEANFPKRGTEAVSRLRIADWELRIGNRPATKRPCGSGTPAEGPVAQTNPIGRNESYETKPIGPPGRCRVGRPTHSLSLRAGSTKNRGPIVQNKPNCPKRGTEAVSAGVAVKSPHYCSFPLFQHSNRQCWAGRGLEDGGHGVPPPPLAPPTLPRENSSEN